MKKTSIYLLFTLLCLAFFSEGYAFYPKGATGQQSEVDSIFNILDSGVDDTTRINLLNTLARKYIRSNPDSSLLLARQALDENNDTHPKGLIGTYNTLGSLQYYQSDYDSSLYYFEKALDVCYKIDNKKGISKLSNNIAIIYLRLGMHSESLEYNLKSLKMKEAQKDTAGIISSLINISNLYYQLDKFIEAIEIGERVLAMAEVSAPNRIPTILNALGTHYIYVKDYEKSLEYLNNAIEINSYNKDDKKLAMNYHNMAETYLYSGNSEEAMNYYIMSLKINEKLGNNNTIAKTQMAIGVLYYETGEYQKSIGHLEKAKNYYESISQIYELKNIYEILAKANGKLNRTSLAYNYLLNYNELHDSIFSIEKTTLVEDLAVQYETDLLEQKNLRQKEEIGYKELIIILFSISIAILIVGLILILFLYRRKQQALIKLAEKNFKIARMECDDIQSLNRRKESTERQKEIYQLLLIELKENRIFTDVGLTIDSLAKATHTNRTELSEVIRKFTGKTYPVFINEYRIDYAIRMLNESQKKFSIDAIAHDAGFKSVSNFYKLFKEFTGLTPSAMQKAKMAG